MFAALAMLLATPNFPAAIQRQLGLSQPPRCTVCHATDQGGIGTVVKPFGKYLQSRGLVPGNENSLNIALLADIGEHHSSNGGQTTDIDALKAGEDPNGTASRLVPAYGCSSGSAAGLLAPLMVVAWVWTQRRRVL
jgi:uncharacterized protein (TIGR03382 family)